MLISIRSPRVDFPQINWYDWIPPGTLAARIIPADAIGGADNKHAVTSLGETCIEGNAQFRRWPEWRGGWRVWSPKSEAPMTADTPPEQKQEAR